MAKTMANDVQASLAKIVAVDGVRRRPDIKYLQEIAGFYLVAIDADQKIRFERITRREENTDDPKKTFETFKQDEQKEAELQIAEVAKAADFILNNDGALDKLYQQIEDILKKIRKIE